MKIVVAIMVAAACFSLSVQPVWADTDTGKLFKKKCSICHKMDKKGMGPAVTAMTSDATVLKSVIADGRKAMPSFEGKLTDKKINALVAYIQSKQTALNPCAKNPSGK